MQKSNYFCDKNIVFCIETLHIQSAASSLGATGRMQLTVHLKSPKRTDELLARFHCIFFVAFSRRSLSTSTCAGDMVSPGYNVTRPRVHVGSCAYSNHNAIIACCDDSFSGIALLILPHVDNCYHSDAERVVDPGSHSPSYVYHHMIW